MSLNARAAVAAASEDAGHLLTMVRDTLAACLQEDVEIVRDVIGLTFDEMHTTILVSPEALRIEFCTIVGHETPDMELLGAVIAEHSSRWPDISIVVTKAHVFAVKAVDAKIFSPDNLVAALADRRRFLREGAIDIEEQLDPGMAPNPECEIEVMPQALAEMIVRYHTDRSTVTADSIMRTSRANGPLLRRYARICQAHIALYTAVAPKFEARGDGDEARRCDNRRQAMETFLPVLLAAIALSAESNMRWERPQGA
ncbi:T3SS (YopN, CesT) and YbjN peptide-binding chaperone 1 [Gordonia sp. NPDC003504]